MAPHAGLTHLKKYDIKDSNVELIGTDIDHQVKHHSAATEPAWNNGIIGHSPGLYIWRIEDFQIIPWPASRTGQFYEGDSYIVLHSYTIGDEEKLRHEIFFWLGSQTSQDEAGTAAYKTVELDEFLSGSAVQHREVQIQPSEEFLSLFPRLKILSGGVNSGFTHVEAGDAEKSKESVTLLRVFKQGGGGGIVVHEVEPTWKSLDDEDVFVLEWKGEKIWVWQGRKASPMEKAKAALVVADLTSAKHINVEVVSQTEARSRVIVDLLGGSDEHVSGSFEAKRPIETAKQTAKKLFRLSDASGKLEFDLVKEGERVEKADFDTRDVFLLDVGRIIWVWRGREASEQERKSWISVAQQYVGSLGERHATPFASVVEGNEGTGFFKALAVV